MKRCLIRNKNYTTSPILEVKIVEYSPSGLYFKYIIEDLDKCVWVNVEDFTILEVLSND